MATAPKKKAPKRRIRQRITTGLYRGKGITGPKNTGPMKPKTKGKAKPKRAGIRGALKAAKKALSKRKSPMRGSADAASAAKKKQLEWTKKRKAALKANVKRPTRRKLPAGATDKMRRVWKKGQPGVASKPGTLGSPVLKKYTNKTAKGTPLSVKKKKVAKKKPYKRPARLTKAVSRGKAGMARSRSRRRTVTRRK